MNTHDVGKHPQSDDGEVDNGVKKYEPSRARVIEEQLAIEPNATASQKILEAFSKSGDLASMVVGKIEEAFNATRCQFNKTTQAWDEIPDYKTRLQACELYLAHTVGLPIQRTENLNLTGKMPGQGGKRKPASPALLAYYARELERAKRQGTKPEAPASEA